MDLTMVNVFDLSESWLKHHWNEVNLELPGRPGASHASPEGLSSPELQNQHVSTGFGAQRKPWTTTQSHVLPSVCIVCEMDKRP